MDCRKVDPEFTKGGLTSKQMAELTRIRFATERAHKAMLMRAAGHSTYEANLAKGRERSAARRQQRKDRVARQREDAA